MKGNPRTAHLFFFKFSAVYRSNVLTFGNGGLTGIFLKMHDPPCEAPSIRAIDPVAQAAQHILDIFRTR